jgi:hypothetical protein
VANLFCARAAEGDIYVDGVSPSVKFLYCPRCKQLHVKPWFAIRNRCQNCFGDATVIQIPYNWMTYMSYALYVLIPALIVIYVTDHVKNILYLAVALLILMMIIAFADIARGEKYAKERIKITTGDVDSFKRRRLG